MSDLYVNFQLVGYGLAGLMYSVLAALLFTSFRGRLRGGTLTIVAAICTVWSSLLAYNAVGAEFEPLQIFFLELVHDAAWLIFLSALLSGAIGGPKLSMFRYGGATLCLVILAAGVFYEFAGRKVGQSGGASNVIVIGSLLTSLYALITVEQIYRNARESQRRGLKFLCLGVGGIFAFDLFLYSNAILVGRIDSLFWSLRGFVVAMFVPLIAVAAQRSPAWAAGIFVSRQIVFYSATVFAAGLYLTIVGFTGYYLRIIGGQWGTAAQILFFVAATILLSVFLFSDTLRKHLRVFISKHFFENKYDYREEWLRLISTLTAVGEDLPLKKRAIKGLAEITETSAGLLWLRLQDGADYKCVAGWNVGTSSSVFSSQHSLVKFLENNGWVIEQKEYSNDPSLYENLAVDFGELDVENPSLIVPLLHDAQLLGFVVLLASATSIDLNYEDRDLLKTAGQQIASYLGQEISTDALAESRQFEAFNKLTAYIMHDIKNLIAQQTLVVENAEKHKDNPEFVDDAISTIRGGVARMHRVLENLHQDPLDRHLEKVEVCKMVLQAVSNCADRSPVPRARAGGEQVWVRADRERLSMALYHAIRNAQDATNAGGAVTVSVDSNEEYCVIEISDTGIGMDDAFVRDRLFRPFDSTKGTQGMGMGAYQIRETILALGGEIRVESTPGEGTTITIKLLLVGR